MGNQQENEIVFRSENIEIIIQDSSRFKGASRLYLLESSSSFNLLFLLSPDIHLKAHDCDIQFMFKKNQYILHYSLQKNKAELWTNSEEPLKYLHIQLNYQYISNLITPETNGEGAEILENMIHNNFVFLQKATPPNMTVEMHIILKEILSYSKKGIMQKLFIEAKIIKLLILIFEQFNEKNNLKASSKAPEIIKKFIDENYHRNIKAEEIGKLIGVNQNLIRKEFKAEYHTTISHYISELRMLKARKLITDKEMMIKEIAIECGYEYLQNFTRAFKKKFGVSPEHLRNNK
ncbi:helix-turn-helix transcriptional regulator [Chryseobacterium jejuense]|uniref:AraC-type DNA-binding protein n=1 Tax=Chryseobacterium jejuense TaxID=445960 RepID=A0A2X2XJF5_CHRJE|nr:AraC family transcriptional regulator [Chryseobacterium jejuense]SDJ71585.1 AraC-type DNA-binding protein [Chryseobacterium jejuense]SQB26480.1 L-rhamnose operon transcriptional activator rhaR [Chryseobacterium jejuense]